MTPCAVYGRVISGLRSLWRARLACIGLWLSAGSEIPAADGPGRAWSESEWGALETAYAGGRLSEVAALSRANPELARSFRLPASGWRWPLRRAREHQAPELMDTLLALGVPDGAGGDSAGGWDRPVLLSAVEDQDEALLGKLFRAGVDPNGVPGFRRQALPVALSRTVGLGTP